MFILMGIWEGHEPYLTPLDSNDTRGLDWEQADRRRPMFQVLSSDRSTGCGGEPIVPIVWNESCIIGDQLSPRRKKKCAHLANNTKDCVPLPNNHFFAMVMDADSPMAKACPQSPFVP